MTFSWRETVHEAWLFRVSYGRGELAEIGWHKGSSIAHFIGESGKQLLAVCVEELKHQGWSWVSPDKVVD